MAGLRTACAAAVLALGLAGRAAAAVAPAEIFCDRMVLQRDAPVPVWGRAAPGTAVTVSFAGQEKRAVAGADGKWTVSLDPMAASAEPRAMTIGDGKETRTITGVLVGDVWLCSGQSNMVYTFGNAPPGFSTDYPLIRGFTVPRSVALEPQETFVAPRAMAGHTFEKETSWFPCSPATAGKFTGVGLYAAIEMFKTINVPIGVLNCSFNGSTAALWIPAEVLRKDGRYDKLLADAEKTMEQYRTTIDQYERDQTLFLSMKKELEEAGAAASDFRDVEDRGLREGWMKPDLAAADWAKTPWGWTNVAPTYLWDGDSILWIRMLCARIKPAAEVRLTGAELRNCTARYFFDGVELKPSGTAKDGREEFAIPRAAGAKETAWLAIRLFSNRKRAGMWRVPSSADMLVLPTPQGVFRVAESREPAEKVRLAGHKYPPAGPAAWPGSRFNAMMNPLVPFAIKGFIWYQGESECMQGLEATRLYAHTLPLLARTWRAAWGGEDKPFIAVQLAGYGYGPQSFLMEMRESQKAILSLPRTALSPSMDIREPGNVHPSNKYDIGTRAGRAALAVAYGKDIVHSGPAYKGMAVEGSRVRVSFDHVGGGLAVGEKNGLAPVRFLDETKVPHFEVAGKDMKFVPAEARIEGQTVVVWSDAVKEPAAVRYAWVNMPENPLLYNKQSLPATSFQTQLP